MKQQRTVEQLLSILGENKIILSKSIFVDIKGEVRDDLVIIDILNGILEENGLT